MKTPFLTFKQIESLSDDKLLSIINSGENLNWQILLPGEPQIFLDEYMQDLFSEKERRGI